MRADDDAGHPFPRQGDRQAVHGEHSEAAPGASDPVLGNGAQGSNSPSKLEASEGTPPEPFIGDPASLNDAPTTKYTSEPIEVEQDSASDSG